MSASRRRAIGCRFAPFQAASLSRRKAA